MYFVLVNSQRVFGFVKFTTVRAGESGRGESEVSVSVIPEVVLVFITLSSLMADPDPSLKMHHRVAQRSDGSNLRVCDNLVFVASDAAAAVFDSKLWLGHLVDLFIGGTGEKVRGLEQVGRHRVGVQELRGGIRERRVHLLVVLSLSRQIYPLDLKVLCQGQKI